MRIDGERQINPLTKEVDLEHSMHANTGEAFFNLAATILPDKIFTRKEWPLGLLEDLFIDPFLQPFMVLKDLADAAVYGILRGLKGSDAKP